MLRNIYQYVRSKTRHAVFQAAFVPLADTSSGPLRDLYNSSAGGGLAGYINGLFKFAIAIGAIVAVLRIAYAGYLYMGQSDMWSTKGKAKEIIGDVILGLLLLLSIYLILEQINPDILNLDALRSIKPASPGSQNEQITM